jgi:hypothetical protein
MQNLTVHLGSPTPLSSRAGPHAPARHPRLPALAATRARPVGASAPLSEQRRAAHARRIWVAAGRDTIEAPPAGRGQAPRRRPTPCGTSAARLPLFSFPLCHTDDRAAQARPRPLVLPSPLLSDSSSRASEPPHRSPHPDRRLRPPASHSLSWIPAEHRHRLPLPGELLPELPIPVISYNFLTPLPLRCCRTPHPPSPPTGASSPPTNAVARHRLRRLTVDPPFRCAPALSSLPGTFPVTPSRSPTTPCRRRATAKPLTSTPPPRPTHGLRVVTAPARAQQAAQAGCPAGLGCQAVA